MTPEHRAEYCRAALHRALTWAEDHPTDLPLLGTPEDAGLCGRGHELAIRKDGRQFCPVCSREKQRERRAT